jgi:tellurite resistance protein
MIDHMTALIYTMILVSAADRDMTDAELRSIGEIVRYLPIFKKFDLDKLPKVAADCAEILDDDEGLDKVLEVIKGALPQMLHETAYAVACDVAAADGHINPEVIRLLELLRHALGVDRLAAAAIERAARARHTVI